MDTHNPNDYTGWPIPEPPRKYSFIREHPGIITPLIAALSFLAGVLVGPGQEVVYHWFFGG